MGLDITAYKSIVPAPDAVVDEDGNPVDYPKFVRVRSETINIVEKIWPGRSAGLAPAIYSFGESFYFRAGSYSGYSWWRNALSQAVLGKNASDAWHSDERGPCVELINFSDCEGVIGPKVCAKLKTDFVMNLQRAFEYATRMTRDDREYFMRAYMDWTWAFEFAADDGFVELH